LRECINFYLRRPHVAAVTWPSTFAFVIDAIQTGRLAHGTRGAVWRTTLN